MKSTGNLALTSISALERKCCILKDFAIKRTDIRERNIFVLTNYGLSHCFGQANDLFVRSSLVSEKSPHLPTLLKIYSSFRFYELQMEK